MRRWWQLRVAAGALLTAASYPIIALGYLADWYRLALAGVFFLWLIRFVIACAGHRDLTPAWRRLRNYVFLQQLAIQFAIRSTAVFLIITAGFGDTEFLELFTLAVVVQLAGRHFSPVLLRGAFSPRVASRNMRNVGDNGSMKLFDASDSRWRRRMNRLRRRSDLFEPVVLVLLVVMGSDAIDRLQWVVGAWVAYGVLQLVLHVGTVIRTVKLGSYARKQQAIFDFIDDYQPTFLVYFSAGGLGSLYQLEQWMPFLESSGHRLLIVTRERKLLDGLGCMARRSSVIWVQRLIDLERLVRPNLQGAIYVNNGMRNGHLLRFNEITHVQLLHGESDKGASANKATRAYDVIAVAGRAAIERYATADVAIPDSQFRVIGRPSTDLIEPVGPDRSVRTFLYAPTWEGHDPAANYSSVPDIAVPSIQWLLEHRPDVRLLVKPHPLTGSADGELKHRLTELQELLAAANEAQGRDEETAHRYLPMSAGVGIIEAFNMSDAILCDISSVPADFLRSGKPMFISDVRRVGTAAIWAEFPTTRGSYTVDGSADGWAAVVGAFEADALSDARAETRRHVLGDFAGPSIDQLHMLLDDIAGFTPERVWDLGDDEDDAAAGGCEDEDD